MKYFFIYAIAVGIWNAGSCFAAEKTAAVAPDTGIPGISDSDEIPDWLVRWELARCLAIVKRYDEAVVEYRLVLKEKPDLKSARIELAQALLWHGRTNEIDAVIENLDSRQLTLEEQGMMAEVYMALKKYDLARPLFYAVLKEKPDEHKIRLKLAAMLSWEKKYEESLAEYRRLLDVFPNDIQLRRKYAMVLVWAGKHEDAIPELRKTLP